VSPAPHSPAKQLPVIDVGALVDPDGVTSDRRSTADAIDRACREVGFFAITGHGVDPDLQPRLDQSAREFFDSPATDKQRIAMGLAGSAWRGWFPVEGELTSGRPDRKEGIYFGLEHPADHPRVMSGTALHGPNQFPEEPTALRSDVLAWLAAMKPVADGVMRGVALGLGLPATWFEDGLTADPTVLFRVFHYPPGESPSEDAWGVGEHTDYGLLTLLAQDHHGGLQVKDLGGGWIDVDPAPGLLICNLGDMLELLTGGRYRSTPHRVRNTSGESRLSFPYFFDPSWDATVPTLPLRDEIVDRADGRWDGADVTAWEGTYGDYLTSKVAKVFPELFATLSPHDLLE